MLKNKILASVLVLLGVFTGSAYSASSVRQLGATSTAKAGAQPATTAAPKARSATPMISKITPQTAVVKSAKTVATPAVAVASSTDSARLMGKAISVGNKTTSTSQPTQNSAATLLHSLNQQVQENIVETSAAIAEANAAIAENNAAITNTAAELNTAIAAKADSEELEQIALRTEKIENKFDKDASGITTLKADIVPTLEMAKVNGLTGEGGLVAVVNAKAAQTEVNGIKNRTIALEDKFETDASGNSKLKVAQIPSGISVEQIDGLKPRLETVETYVGGGEGGANGLLARTTALEDKFNKDESNNITTLKSDYIATGIPAEKVSGLTGTNSISSRLAGVEDKFETDGKLKVAQVPSGISVEKIDGLKPRLENIETYVGGGEGGANGLLVRTAALEDKFNKDGNNITTLKPDYVPNLEMAKINGLSTGTNNVVSRLSAVESTMNNETNGLARAYALASDAVPSGNLNNLIDAYVNTNSIATKTDISNTVNGLKLKNNNGTVQYSIDNGTSWSVFSDGANGHNIKLKTDTDGALKWAIDDDTPANQVVWHKLYDKADLQGTTGCSITATKAAYENGDEKGTEVTMTNSCGGTPQTFRVPNGTKGKDGEDPTICDFDITDYKENNVVKGIEIQPKTCGGANYGTKKLVRYGENGQNPVFRVTEDSRLQWKLANDSDSVYEQAGHDLGSVNVSETQLKQLVESELNKLDLASASEFAALSEAVYDTNSGLSTKATEADLNTLKNFLVDEDNGELEFKGELVKTSAITNDKGFLVASDLPNYDNVYQAKLSDAQLAKINNAMTQLPSEALTTENYTTTLDNAYQKKLSETQINKINNAMTSLPAEALTTENYTTTLDNVYQPKLSDTQINKINNAITELPSNALTTGNYPTTLDNVYQAKLSETQINKINNAMTELPSNVIRSGDSFKGAFDDAFAAKDLDTVYQAKLSAGQIEKINNAMTTLPADVLRTTSTLDATKLSGTIADARLNSSIVSGAAAGATAAGYFTSGVLNTNALPTVPANKIADLSATYATTSALSGKQDTISDLSTIRSGATAGATAAAKFSKTDGLLLEANLPTTVVKSTDTKYSAVMSNFDNSGNMDSTVLQTAADAALANNTDFAAMQTAINGTCGDEKTGGQSCIPSINEVVQALIDAEIVSQTCGNHGCTWHAVRNTQSTAEQ